MKITFDEISENKELWIHSELLQSLPLEVTEKAAVDQFYEVKLVVNGIEVDPQIYNKIMRNVDNYIELRAKQIIADKLDEAYEMAKELHDKVLKAKNSIGEKFNI